MRKKNGDELINKKVQSAQFNPEVMYHRADSLQILPTSLTPYELTSEIYLKQPTHFYQNVLHPALQHTARTWAEV